MRTIFKSIFVALLIFSLASCNDRLEGDEILSTEPLKIDSVKIAQDTMDIYTTQTIKTYSQFSTQCEGFYGYDYQHVAPLERKVISYKLKLQPAVVKLRQEFHRSISGHNKSELMFSDSGTAKIQPVQISGSKRISWFNN